MTQTYKKVLLLLAITCLAGLNSGCHKKIYPSTYPNKPGLFPITIPFKEYRLKRKDNNEMCGRNKAERKINRKKEKDKRDELKDQEKARKKHISQQNPKVQERMKKSLKESEQTRKRKSFWERLIFWKRGKSVDKRRK